MKKEWMRRALRTFGQAFIAVIVTDVAAGIDLTDAKGLVQVVLMPAIAAGIAAVMNMKESEDKNENE